MKIIQNRKIWISISLILIIIGLAFVIFNTATGNGPFNYSVEFAGGTSIEVNIPTDFDRAELEKLIDETVPDEHPSVQKVESENKAIIKLKSELENTPAVDAEASDSAAEATTTESDSGISVTGGDGIKVDVEGAEAESEIPTQVNESDAQAEVEVTEEAASSVVDEDAEVDTEAENETATAMDADAAAQAAEEAQKEAEAQAKAEAEAFGNAVATGEGYEGNVAKVIAVLGEKYGVTNNGVSVTQISATISSEMTRNAILAVLLSCIAMLIYVSIRFKDFNTGASSIIALLHDALIVLACYAVLRIPLSNSFIAAILTVLGYSINASIVIFDRIRENKHAHRKMSAEELVDTSVNQCMKRSIYTSLTTLFTIGSLYILGVQSVKEFALPIVVGIIAGTWSSVFISGSVWYELSKIKTKKRK